MVPDNKDLDTAALAAELGIGVHKARELMHAEDFPSYWLGPRSPRVSRKALEDWKIRKTEEQRLQIA